MKNTSLFGMLICLITLPFAGFGQGITSGVIDYTITMERRSFHRPGADTQESGPQQFTMKRQLVFNNQAGKFAAPASKHRNNRRSGNFGAEFIDFNKKAYIRTFKRRNNDTTFYIARPFKEAEGFQLTGKTKKLLGYNSQEATATLRNGKVTLWFTKDLPFSFSPVNGLIPPNGGVVLDIQNNRMHYQATAVDAKQVEASTVTIPGPSSQVSSDALRKSFHGRNRGRGQWNNHRGDR